MAAKAWAAALLGFPAAVAIVAVLIAVTPGPLATRTLPLLLLFFPIWVGVISGAFVCRSGAAAAGWLSGITLIGFAVLHLSKALGWAGLAG